MTQVSFTIPGRLKGKGRHRTRVVKTDTGKTFAQTYPEPQTVQAEAMVRSFAEKAMEGKPPLEGPLDLFVDLYVNTPTSWSKKKKASTTWVTGKPDCDNQIKLLGDACNGILWKDDSQVAAIRFRRTYFDGAGERTFIVVTEL